MWTLVVAYVLVVIFYWTPESSWVLRILSIPVWVAILLHLASVAGPLRVPLVVAILVLMAVGFITEISKERKAAKKEIGITLGLTTSSFLHENVLDISVTRCE